MEASNDLFSGATSSLSVLPGNEEDEHDKEMAMVGTFTGVLTGAAFLGALPLLHFEEEADVIRACFLRNTSCVTS